MLDKGVALWYSMTMRNPHKLELGEKAEDVLLQSLIDLLMGPRLPQFGPGEQWSQEPLTEQEEIERESGIVSVGYKRYRDGIDRVQQTGEI